MRSERGASSVLVIFMMIILVVLGTLALTASYANLRLSRRTHAAYADMYRLDASAETVIARVDALLKDAEDNARAYMEHGAYTLMAGGDIKGDAQRAIYNAYMATAYDSGARASYMDALYKRLYLYFALEALTPMRDAGEIELSLDDRYAGADALLFSNTPVPDDEALSIRFNISFGDEPGARQLSCDLDAICPGYTVRDNAGVATLERVDESARMRLTAWRQWQVPFEYEDGFNFDSTVVDEGN